MTWPAVPPQHRLQRSTAHIWPPELRGIHPNDTRRRAICSGGSIVATAPISPQISDSPKYSKNEGNLRGRWMQRPRATPQSKSPHLAFIQMVLVNGRWSSGGHMWAVDNVVGVEATGPGHRPMILGLFPTHHLLTPYYLCYSKFYAVIFLLA